MKKIILLSILFFLTFLNAGAVLKEKNLSQTIHVLRLELYNQWQRQKENMKTMEKRNEKEHEDLKDFIERSNRASLMLYSQGENFTFDVAYACQEATSLYREFRMRRTLSFEDIKSRIESEIARYDSLIYALNTLPPALIKIEEHHHHHHSSSSLFDNNGELKSHDHDRKEAPIMLDKQGQADREMCIKYAETLRDNLKNILERLADDNEHRESLADRIKKMNDYAQKKYNKLQTSIFINKGTGYLTLLFSAPQQWRRMKNDFTQKYMPLKEKRGNSQQFRIYPSEWRGGIVLFSSIFMFFYMFGATIISNIIIRWLVPKRIRNKESFKNRRATLITTGAIFIFSIAVMIARKFMVGHDLMIMASSLMIQMAWLMTAIWVSMIIRMSDEQLREGAKIYNPFIIMSLIVICFRIVLIPNTLVNLIFPPILLLFTIWQVFTLKKCSKDVPTIDRICCSVSLTAMVVSTVLAWIGFTLMAVQILVWWMFLLAVIATITCIYDLMEMYESRILFKRVKKEHTEMNIPEIRRRMKRGDFVSKTWIYDFFNRALVPVCAVYSVLFSVIMAANIFNLTDLVFKWFMQPFTLYGADGKVLVSISAFHLCLIIALYFIFKYINYLLRSAWFGYHRSLGNADFNATLARNIIGIVTWGIYLIVCFVMLKVPPTGIAVVTGGLSTGLGFASKSLLENFFYGISLMSGRVRVGDYIECDGTTGKVESITYQSTQITTLDGSIVAFLNSDLFSKNFKNLTRNHQYVLVKIPIGVAYGTNINKVREMLIDGMKKLNVKTNDGRNIVRPDIPVKVAFAGFGDSSVDLVVIAWILVDQQPTFTAQINEMIYNVLNENNVEIPFPQHDIHMRKD